MSVGSQRNTERPRQTKVRQLEVTLSVDQKVLGLQVSMEDAVAVAVPDALDELGHELLDHCLSQAHVQGHQRSIWKGFAAATFADWKSLHVLFEIEVKEFEDEVQLVAICVDNIEEPHNVWIFHLLEQGDFPNGGARDTLIFSLEADLLQGDDTVGVAEFTGLVDNAVGS